MLRAFIKVCKDLDAGYDPTLVSVEIDLAKASCPHCKATGSLSTHATYKRNYISAEGADVGGGIVESVIEITRLKCPSCKKTHAVLPLTVVPYSPFSVSFIAQVLIDCDRRCFPSIEKLCEHYRIAVSTFYRLAERFKSCVGLAMGAACGKDAMWDTARMLTSGAIKATDAFLSAFFEMTGRSFCQSRSP
jgi:transposase-like protein